MVSARQLELSWYCCCMILLKLCKPHLLPPASYLLFWHYSPVLGHVCSQNYAGQDNAHQIYPWELLDICCATYCAHVLLQTAHRGCLIAWYWLMAGRLSVVCRPWQVFSLWAVLSFIPWIRHVVQGLFSSVLVGGLAAKQLGGLVGSRSIASGCVILPGCFCSFVSLFECTVPLKPQQSTIGHSHNYVICFYSFFKFCIQDHNT